MRLTFTLFCLLIISYSAQATRWTVSNSSARPAQFTQPQAAVDTAQAGDTILIYTNVNRYENFTINKPDLVIIGEGYSGFTTASENYITNYIYLEDGANNIVIKDLSIVYLTFGRRCCTVFNLANIEIDNSLIYAIDINYSNINGFVLRNSVLVYRHTSNNRAIKNAIISNNVLNNIFLPSDSENISIYNNVFDGGYSFYDRLYIDNSSNVSIFSNVFIPAYNGYNNSYDAIELQNTPQSVLISNNIFYKIRIRDNFPCTSCVYANNLTFENSDSITVLNNNIIEQDPLFITAPEGNDIYDWRKYDFRLAETSPAKGTASDGRDLGIYGGVNPTPYPNIYGKSSLPKVTRLFILNQLVGKDESIEIELEATSSKN